jgi:hypothetical protein
MTTPIVHLIPPFLNHMLKKEMTAPPSVWRPFQEALPRLLDAYGTACSNQGVCAEMSHEQKQSDVFWRAISHHHSRSPIERECEFFEFYLGFRPEDEASKRMLIDETARLITNDILENDEERDMWLDENGESLYTGYHHYRRVIKMSWKLD